MCPGRYTLQVNNTYKNLSHIPECTKTGLMGGGEGFKFLESCPELKDCNATKAACLGEG